MGDVIHLAERYRHEVRPLKVRTWEMGEPGETVYLPVPSSDWSPNKRIAWLAGVIQHESGVPIQISRQTSKRGPYALQLGDRPAMTQLDETRVWDILGGFLEAVKLGLLR